MTLNQVLIVLASALILGVSVVLFMAPRGSTANLRSLVTRVRIPPPAARLFVNLLAVLLVLTSVMAMMQGIAHGAREFVQGVVFMSAGIGLFLRLRWAFIGAYALLSGCLIMHVLRVAFFLPPDVRFALTRPAPHVRQLPLGALSEMPVMFFNFWGIPNGVTIACVYASVLALLAMSDAALRPLQGGNREYAQVSDKVRRRTVIIAIYISAAAMIVPVILVLIALITEGVGRNPGGFGSGYHALFTAMFGAPFVIAGFVGLVISLLMLQKINKSSDG